MGVYQNAIEYFKRVADSRYVAAGLTSNVDLLVRWDTGVIQKWVDQYATGPRNISNVESMTDLVDMLLFRLPEGDGVLHLRGGREDNRKLLKDGLLRRRRYRRPGGLCFGQLWCEKSGAFN